MNSGSSPLGRFLRAFRKSEDGGPTVEFALVFMPFMVLAISAFELGLLMTRHVMLERGLDMAVREVRTSSGTPVDEDTMKRMVCNGAGIIPNCMTQLRLEMVRIDMHQSNSLNASALPPAASCTDISDPFLPSRNFQNGVPDMTMIVRACGLFSPMIPGMGLGYFLANMDRGYYRLVSTSAFIAEPV